MVTRRDLIKRALGVLAGVPVVGNMFGMTRTPEQVAESTVAKLTDLSDGCRIAMCPIPTKHLIYSEQDWRIISFECPEE